MEHMVSAIANRRPILLSFFSWFSLFPQALLSIFFLWFWNCALGGRLFHVCYCSCSFELNGFLIFAAIVSFRVEVFEIQTNEKEGPVHAG
ncbi:hypothetical protein BDZ45DRAFT_26257 [Acephala macrosclerotiorum]|nr:hypothetical protein BDZ45DRAFT_26257 [Acephala macrosclerotiorum]